MQLTKSNSQSWLETVWLALDPLLDEMPEDQKDDVCTALAWITEGLNEAGHNIDDQF
jgi:hypothetical protein